MILSSLETTSAALLASFRAKRMQQFGARTDQERFPFLSTSTSALLSCSLSLSRCLLLPLITVVLTGSHRFPQNSFQNGYLSHDPAISLFLLQTLQCKLSSFFASRLYIDLAVIGFFACSDDLFHLHLLETEGSIKTSYILSSAQS